jgi:hypothetical protein
MESQYKQNITFENVWKKPDQAIQLQVAAIWKNLARFEDAKIQERMTQLVYVAKDGEKVVAVSTAFKAYIAQLRNFFYVFRCLVLPQHSIPGIDAKITVLTRDFLESIHKHDGPDEAIGLLALIENQKLKERTQAIWPASGLVYIGNSKEGHHIRVYYFKKAVVKP